MRGVSSHFTDGDAEAWRRQGRGSVQGAWRAGHLGLGTPAVSHTCDEQHLSPLLTGGLSPGSQSISQRRRAAPWQGSGGS